MHFAFSFFSPVGRNVMGLRSKAVSHMWDKICLPKLRNTPCLGQHGEGNNTKDHRLLNASFPALHNTHLDIIILQYLPSSSPQSFCIGPCPCCGNPDVCRLPVKQQAIAGCHRKRSNITPELLVEQASIPIMFENHLV